MGNLPDWRWVFTARATCIMYFVHVCVCVCICVCEALDKFKSVVFGSYSSARVLMLHIFGVKPQKKSSDVDAFTILKIITFKYQNWAFCARIVVFCPSGSTEVQIFSLDWATHLPRGFVSHICVRSPPTYQIAVYSWCRSETVFFDDWNGKLVTLTWLTIRVKGSGRRVSHTRLLMNEPCEHLVLIAARLPASWCHLLTDGGGDVQHFCDSISQAWHTDLVPGQVSTLLIALKSFSCYYRCQNCCFDMRQSEGKWAWVAFKCPFQDGRAGPVYVSRCTLTVAVSTELGRLYHSRREGMHQVFQDQTVHAEVMWPQQVQAAFCLCFLKVKNPN